MSQAEATDSTTEGRKLVDPLECEDDLSEIVRGLAALHIISDAIGNGASTHSDEHVEQAIELITSHMDGAASRLTKTLGLD